VPTLTEGNLEFSFPRDWAVKKIETFSFYRNQFQQVCGGSKIVDFVCRDSQNEIWLIEVKDYRHNRREKSIELAFEFALKVRDSLALLATARVNANDHTEKNFAHQAMGCQRIHIVLHIEEPSHPSKLFPATTKNANILLKLKQLLKPIDPHPKIVSRTNTNRIPYSVT
jgi:hypothetical protein